MKKQVHDWVTSPLFLLAVIVASSVLTYHFGGIGYFLGLLFALLTLWSNGVNWTRFGIYWNKARSSLGRSSLYALGIFLLMDVLAQPFIEQLLGPVDLSSFQDVRGNLSAYLFLIFFMWVFAAFGEEFIYRGYFMKHSAEIFGDSDKAWIISAVFISALFGLAHLYQGWSGVVGTGIIGFLLSLIFLKHKENLVMAMLTHGFYDMIGITLIYFSKERFLTDYVDILLF